MQEKPPLYKYLFNANVYMVGALFRFLAIVYKQLLYELPPPACIVVDVERTAAVAAGADSWGKGLS